MVSNLLHTGIASSNHIDKDNHDASNEQVEAVWLKNDLWVYANQEHIKQQKVAADKIVAWTKINRKARRDVRYISKEVWTKLANGYQSKERKFVQYMKTKTFLNN